MLNQEELQFAQEGNKIRCWLFFNKVNGIYLHAANWVEKDTMTGLEYYTLVDTMFDLFNDEVVGTYPDYTIRKRGEGPQPYYEAQADALMATKITKKYPIAEQVNVLGRAIFELAEKHKLELPELTEMLDYIKLCKEVNASTKEFYRESPDFIYISNEQSAENEAARYEGGLHEHLGARAVTGGRVFG